METTANVVHYESWNKGKIVGQKGSEVASAAMQRRPISSAGV